MCTTPDFTAGHKNKASDALKKEGGEQTASKRSPIVGEAVRLRRDLTTIASARASHILLYVGCEPHCFVGDAFINRRQFLKLTGAVLLASILTPGRASGSGAEPVSVPPSLMLHSRHRWRLEAILVGLRRGGFEGVTYADLEGALLGQLALPARPVLITIDDVCPARGSPSFAYFAAMKDLLVEYGFKATFSVITRPDVPHDDAAWDQLASWLQDGIRLETHTAYHSNLDNPTFAAGDYEEEIGGSAALIRARTGCDVRALILPYGSGHYAQTGKTNPRIVAACQQAGLRFVVGITGGRTPLPVDIAPDEVLYVGRVGPGVSDDAWGALYELAHWDG